MEFTHTPYQPGETIAAIATAPGEGGVAIIRISGNAAITIASKIFSGPVHTYKSHSAHYGQVLDQARQYIDNVLLLPMLGKRSYTGEDTVEIHCHGGSFISRRVLEVVISAGARVARPGEFTFKAFMNGKLDLAQAEAVQGLICAKNEHALDAATNQLKGALSQKVTSFQQQLTLIAAILDAWIDFPEEGLEFASLEEICATLQNISQQMQQLLATFHDGKIAHEGLSVCLIGCPNVGKSSLMNALLDRDRAIVSPIPGTTRDLLEDHLCISGLNIRLMDTAGIHHSDEWVEQEGIRRSKEAMTQADLILLVLDAHRGLEKNDHWLIEQLPAAKTIAIWNKTDLPHSELPPLPFPYIISISAKEKTGLDLLRKSVDAVIWENGPPSREEVLVTNVRHKEALAEAAGACLATIHGLETGISPEFLSIDIRSCLHALGKIIGTNITEDILSAIFSKFCIGK